MTTVKGKALVTFGVPFEYEVDDQEFEEWAGKPISEASEREIESFMDSESEPWEHEAVWPSEVGWWSSEIYGVDIASLERRP